MEDSGQIIHMRKVYLCLLFLLVSGGAISFFWHTSQRKTEEAMQNEMAQLKTQVDELYVIWGALEQGIDEEYASSPFRDRILSMAKKELLSESISAALTEEWVAIDERIDAKSYVPAIDRLKDLKGRLEDMLARPIQFEMQLRKEAEDQASAKREADRFEEMRKGISEQIKVNTEAGGFVVNSIGMKLVYIPATTSNDWKTLSGGKDYFVMGSPLEEKERLKHEKQHRVRLTKSFYLGATEVSQTQWQKVMGSNPSHLQGGNLPVENVSWHEAVAFCKKLSQREKVAYRLPTEWEWEYACRAGSTTPFHYGESLDSSQANFDGEFPYGNASQGINLDRTAVVGSYQPNRWGLYDMHGNVSEFCQNWYGSYPDGILTNPQGYVVGTDRVFRGGSWFFEAGFSRSAWRDRIKPDRKARNIGLRVLLES